MNCKKHRQIISVLMLFLISAAILLPAQALGEAEARELLSGMGELTPLENTPYLLAKEKKGTLYGVYNTDGEQLIPFDYTALDYLGFNCFCARKESPVKWSANKPVSLQELNANAVITAEGTQITDFLYGKVEVFGPYWACGWVLEEATGDDFDFESQNQCYFKIQRCDFYYLGDHAQTSLKGTEELPPSLSLTREAYMSAKGHGKYLYIQDREGQIRIYDSQFNQVNAEVNSLDDPMYVIKNFAVVARGSSEILLDGFSAVQEAQTDAGLLLKVTRLDYSGNKWIAVYTIEGEELMPLFRGEIATITKDYAVISVNKLRGLYSFKEHKQLVPCEYNKVIAVTTTLDPYVIHGFVSVEKGGTCYYYHVADGELYESTNPANKWKKVGLAYVINDGAHSRYRVMAPDQAIADVNDSKLANDQSRGSGYVLAFTSQLYNNMVVTWRGERVLKHYGNSFVFTDDDRVIARRQDGSYLLFEVVSDE